MFNKVYIPYSLKNIPTPNKDFFMKHLLSRTEDFIQRLRWKVLFFLQPETKGAELKTFGFRTEKSAPQIKELTDFENDPYSVIEKLEFSENKTMFQKRLHEDSKKINCVAA